MVARFIFFDVYDRPHMLSQHATTIISARYVQMLLSYSQ